MTQISLIYDAFLKSSGVCTDTRKLLPGSLFVALSGSNFDGNAYALEALNAGAAYAVVSAAHLKDEPRCFWVPDTLIAFQELARHHRRQFDIPILALTGSNGKTTTKELIFSVMKHKFKAHATKGNLNNHIGVPLSLLEMPANTEFAIIEMGANHQGEIAALSKIAEPNYGLITNVGSAHLEGFGGLEGVRKGKSELYRFLGSHSGTAFVNTDQPFLPGLAEGVERQVCYNQEGIKGEESFRIELSASYPKLSFLFFNKAMESAEPEVVETNLYGDYNLSNILAAISIAWHFGVLPSNILKGIKEYNPSNNRSEKRKIGSNTVLLDAYNANPSSMASAIEHFLKIPGKKKYFILGDMFELGDESATAHQAILDTMFMHEHVNQWDQAFLIGKTFYSFHKEYPNKCRFFENGKDFKNNFSWSVFSNSLFLIKGSRGMELEKILEERDQDSD